MEQQVTDILKNVGEDPTREGLRDTPKRASQAMQFLTKGYHEDIDEIINGAVFESENSEMVILKNIELYSLCEHHMLPFFGKCHIGYIPDGKVIGISKLARIVEHFARRLQIQENLTQQIANCVIEKIGAQGVGVVIEAKHFCMMMRGVEKQNSEMLTSVMLGQFRESDKTRAEFLSLIK